MIYYLSKKYILVDIELLQQGQITLHQIVDINNTKNVLSVT